MNGGKLYGNDQPDWWTLSLSIINEQATGHMDLLFNNRTIKNHQQQ